MIKKLKILLAEILLALEHGMTIQDYFTLKVKKSSEDSIDLTDK